MADERQTLGGAGEVLKFLALHGSRAGLSGPYDNVKEGFGSVVAQLPERCLALKVPKIGNNKDITSSLDGLTKAGIDCQAALLFNANGTCHQIELNPPLDAEQVDTYAGDAALVVMMLELLPGDHELLEIMEVIPNDELITLYLQAGRHTRQWHERMVDPQLDQRSWRIYSSNQIIVSDERLDTIATFLRQQDGVCADQLDNIREKMLMVAQIQQRDEVPLRRVHGDNWEGNWRLFVNEMGEDDVILFDPALAYGPAGIDVGFAIGKQLIRYVALGDETALSNINAFFEGYGMDSRFSEAMREVWNPLVYKMLVGAAFDRYDQSTCTRLINYAESMLDYILENPGAEFNLSLAKELWDVAQSR